MPSALRCSSPGNQPETPHTAHERAISKALRLCLSLGGKTGSTDLRGWASLELNGYRGQDVPEYRRIVALLQVDGMTMSHHVKGQTISTYDLPDFVGDTISENVEFRQSLPGLVDLVTQAKKKDEPVRLMAPGATDVVAYMNRKKEQFNHIENLYWSIASSAIQEVIDRVRSNLLELVAEMRAGMSSGDAIPSSESLARIEAGAEGGALVERTTTTCTAKDGTATTTVRERFTPPDWRADGWFLERRHPTDWSRRTELVLPDHEQAAEADPLVGVHDELRLARLARQKQQGKSV